MSTIGPSGASQNVTLNLKVLSDPSNASTIKGLGDAVAKFHAGMAKGPGGASGQKSPVDALASSWNKLPGIAAKAQLKINAQAVASADKQAAEAERAADKQAAAAERSATQQIAAARRIQREDASRERLLLRSEVRQDAMAHKFVHGAMDMSVAAAGVVQGVAEIGLASEKDTARLAEMFVKFKGIFDLVQHGTTLLWGMSEAMLTLKRYSHAVAQEEMLRAAATATANAANLVPSLIPSRGGRIAGLAEHAAIDVAAVTATRGNAIAKFFTKIGPKLGGAALGILRFANVAIEIAAAAVIVQETFSGIARSLGIVNQYTESATAVAGQWLKSWRASGELAEKNAKMEKARAQRLEIAERMEKRDKLLGEIGGSFRSEQRSAAVRAGKESAFNSGELARARAGVADANREMAAAVRSGSATPDEKLAQSLERLKAAQDHILESKEKEVQLAKQAVEEEKKRLDDITLAYAKLPKGDRATIESIGLRGGPKNEREARYLEGVLGKAAAMEQFWRAQVTGQEQKALGNIFGLKNTPLASNLADKQRDMEETDRARMDTVRQISQQKADRGGVTWAPETSADTPGAAAANQVGGTIDGVRGDFRLFADTVQRKLAALGNDINSAVRNLNNGLGNAL